MMKGLKSKNQCIFLLKHGSIPDLFDSLWCSSGSIDPLACCHLRISSTGGTIVAEAVIFLVAALFVKHGLDTPNPIIVIWSSCDSLSAAVALANFISGKQE
jgi:hypothetical protein